MFLSQNTNFEAMYSLYEHPVKGFALLHSRYAVMHKSYADPVKSYAVPHNRFAILHKSYADPVKSFALLHKRFADPENDPATFSKRKTSSTKELCRSA